MTLKSPRLTVATTEESARARSRVSHAPRTTRATTAEEVRRQRLRMKGSIPTACRSLMVVQECGIWAAGQQPDDSGGYAISYIPTSSHGHRRNSSDRHVPLQQ